MFKFWLTRPYANRVYRAFITGNITEREHFVRKWFFFWRIK